MGKQKSRGKYVNNQETSEWKNKWFDKQINN